MEARTVVLNTPPLDYPFPPRTNEHAGTAQHGTSVWVRSFRLLPDEKSLALFDATGLGHLAARNHPDLPAEDLRFISDWYAWLFLRDDKGDASPAGRDPRGLSAADGRLLDVLEGAEPGREDEPLAHALLDLRERTLGYLRANSLPGVWMRRLVRAVREHLEATLWEATNRARGVPPRLEAYMRMRPLTGGLSIVTELVEIVRGRHLPSEVREHPAVRHLTSASHNVTCWANDIISLRKELAAGEVNNLILVLQAERDLSLQRALWEAARMHDAEVDVFVQTSRALPTFGPAVDEILRHYVLSLEARMRGVLDWSLDSERYRSEEAMISPASRASTGLENRNP
jgi:5-epi-alpha-selinene synthase